MNRAVEQVEHILHHSILNFYNRYVWDKRVDFEPASEATDWDDEDDE